MANNSGRQCTTKNRSCSLTTEQTLHGKSIPQNKPCVNAAMLPGTGMSSRVGKATAAAKPRAIVVDTCRHPSCGDIHDTMGKRKSTMMAVLTEVHPRRARTPSQPPNTLLPRMAQQGSGTHTAVAALLSVRQPKNYVSSLTMRISRGLHSMHFHIGGQFLGESLQRFHGGEAAKSSLLP